MALKLNGTNSVASPAYAGDDADTGLQCGTNELKLVTGGTEAITVDSSQKVGIGTTSPDALLNVSLAADSTDTYFHGGGVRGLKISDSTDTNDGDITTFHKNSATGQYKFSNYTATRMHLDEDGHLNLTPAHGNNNNVLTLSIERGWQFRQMGTGSGTQLGLYSTSNKGFQIGGDTNGAPTVTVTTGTSKTFYVHGTLSKSGGSFRIPHPLPSKTNTHDLVHSFVEAPDASNLYAGMVDLVDGTATVNIDTAHRMTEGTFEALNHLQSWSSSNESGYAPVKCSMSGNLLTIECQDATSTDTVYYEVRGIRKDQFMTSADTDWTDQNGRVITEPLKTTGETEDPS
tara:strand:- start:2757 stop:3788 length:1032 start_codon:yes stop_codon:yes gene_type:complete